MAGKGIVLALAAAAVLAVPGCTGCTAREFQFGRQSQSGVPDLGGRKVGSARPSKPESSSKKPPGQEAQREKGSESVPDTGRPMTLDRPVAPYQPRFNYPQFPWPRRHDLEESSKPAAPLWDLQGGFRRLSRILAEGSGPALLRQEGVLASGLRQTRQEGLSWQDLVVLGPDPGPALLPAPVRALAGKPVDLAGFMVRPGPEAPAFLVPSLWDLRLGRVPDLHERILLIGVEAEPWGAPTPLRVKGVLRVEEVRTGGTRVAVYALEAGSERLLGCQDEG